MTAARPDEPLVPSVEVLVNGTPLPPAAAGHVQRVTVDVDVGLPSMFAVELSGSDDENTPLPWVDDTLFAIGNTVEVKMGYYNHLDRLIIGEVVGLEPTFANDRLPNLTVRGYDRRHRLQRGRKTRTFVQQKDSDIATRIAGDAGLKAQAQDSQVVHDYVLQANQTDMDFLLERARRIQYEVVVDDKTLVFRPVANTASETVTLTLNADLLEFNPRLSSVRQVGEVRVRGWSPKDKKGITATASTADVNSTMGGAQSGPALSAVFNAAAAVVGDRPVFTQSEADQVAKARLNNAALAFITGELTCLGRTDVQPGQVVKIDGVGTRFGGQYYVTAATHRYSPLRGYYTHLTLCRNAS
jgi:phage protein D